MLFGKDLAQDFKHIEYWFNTPKPLHLADFEEKVILLDFFAYSCINCRRELPHVIALYKKYKPYGLVVIGVHAPEFEFEKIPDNMKDIVHQEKIPYPVAMDNDLSTWYLYGGEYWPRQVVIDHKKRILLNVTGEGHSHKIEQTIREALQKKGIILDEVPFETFQEHTTSFRQTPEIYTGFFRNKDIGSTFDEHQKKYIDPTEEHKEGILYPNGAWKQNYEYFWHELHTKEYEHLTIVFHAQEANIVAMPYTPGETAKVYVEINRCSIPQKLAGKDIRYEDGQSYVLLDKPELYQLFKSGSRKTYELRLVTNSTECCIFSFTFG